MFNDLQNNTTADADEVMENFKHVNYGSNLIPVDVDGDGVDAALDIGTESYRFRDGFFSGNVLPKGQYRIALNSARFTGGLGDTQCPNNAWTAVFFNGWDLGNLSRQGITLVGPSYASAIALQGDGIWLITASITFVGNGTGVRGLGIRTVGSSTVRANTMAAGIATHDQTLQLTTFITGTSGQQLELVAFQNSGATLTIRQSSFNNVSISPTQGTTRWEVWRVA